jgi:hypothetical protein
VLKHLFKDIQPSSTHVIAERLKLVPVAWCNLRDVHLYRIREELAETGVAVTDRRMF